MMSRSQLSFKAAVDDGGEECSRQMMRALPAPGWRVTHRKLLRRFGKHNHPWRACISRNRKKITTCVKMIRGTTNVGGRLSGNFNSSAMDAESARASLAAVVPT